MSDLIDRKDLGAAIDNWLAIDRYYHPYSKQKTIPVSELVDIIKLLPSAQSEIVRCGECKWWNFAPDNTMLPDWHGCRYYGARMHTRVEDFCSRGERRE